MRTFEDLISGCLETGRRFHLLYVYLRLARPEGDATLAELFPDQDMSGVDSLGVILFDAHEPVKPGLTFETMRAHADAYCDKWDVVFIMTARNADDSPVTDEQAKNFLADMRERILSGKFPEWAPVFDHDGALKGVDKARPIRIDPAHRRSN
ncbi:hypothetical protein [Pseudodesulfovibrio sp.]|uniref:hypothetical protein n=1 Tax=unclassified Pseudodesulfovibrio TaxID=2661612 RepID=UPI003B009E5C